MLQRWVNSVLVLLGLVWALMALSGSSAFSGEGIVYPGKGVDDIQIGGRFPSDKKKAFQGKGITIESDPAGRVTKVRVSAPTFSVAISLLRIKSSRIGDVLRFYGKGETDLKSERLILRYPSQGIDFEIDKVNERIDAITVYSPSRPSFSIEQYKQFPLQRR